MTRASISDPQHQPARLLCGNALLALDRHEEAVAELRVPAEAGDAMAMAQLGICYETLGCLEEAEATLRALLEQDRTYQTRHSMIAMYDQSPFWADVHHALARVLQGRREHEEARLHYHLTKRIDPETVLDPRYLEIMSTEELEDHPIDRVFAEPSESEAGGPLNLEVMGLIRAATYADMVRAAAGASDELLEHLAAPIEAAQLKGEFELAARLRPVIDVVGGEDARELYDAVQTFEWQRLFELAGRAATGHMTISEAGESAAAEGPRPRCS